MSGAENVTASTGGFEKMIDSARADVAPPAEVETAESHPDVPQQRTAGETPATIEGNVCMHCGKTRAGMETAPGKPDQFRCASPTSYWDSTCSRFLPHCPPWCTEPHLPTRTSLDKVDRWLHYSDSINTAFPDPEVDGLGTVMVEARIFAREPVGEELNPVEVHLGDIIMSPAQVKAFASVLKTTALLASITTGGRAKIETWQGCEYLQEPKLQSNLFLH
jgi:hypothetical protein